MSQWVKDLHFYCFSDFQMKLKNTFLKRPNECLFILTSVGSPSVILSLKGQTKCAPKFQGGVLTHHPETVLWIIFLGYSHGFLPSQALSHLLPLCVVPGQGQQRNLNQRSRVGCHAGLSAAIPGKRPLQAALP